MMDFYLLPSMQLSVFFIVSLAVFSLQCVYIAKRVFRYDNKRNIGFVGEVFMLIYIAVLVLIPASVYGYRPHGVINNVPIENALLCLGLLITLAFTFSIHDKKRQRVSAVFCAFVTQPILASPIHISYHFLWVIGIMLILLRAYFILFIENTRQKKELSTASIQDGLDSLPTGILFCGEDGYIYLVNKKMQSIMLRFFGAELKNGKHLWDKLLAGEIKFGKYQSIDEDILICTEHDAWHFARRSFRVKHTNFIEITAVDATESYTVLRELENERDELAKESLETAKLAETMETVQKEREYLRIRSQVHDVLGQQLTAMQRLSQSGNIAQYNELLAHSHEAIEQIKGQHQTNAQLFYEEIVDYFNKIGLEIRLKPELPTESAVAFLLLTALREACTNAIRHAGATLVLVSVEHGPEGYRIEIKNNGDTPKKGITEGGGLFGIRTRVEDAGGTLKVEVIPEFSLVINVSSAKIKKENKTH